MDYSKWIFEDIGKGREEAFFPQKEAELLEKLRRKFHEEQDRERLAEEVGVHDGQILAAFEELGFTRETVTILHLVPLVQVAWSDGGVSEGERSKIRGNRGATRGHARRAWLRAAGETAAHAPLRRAPSTCAGASSEPCSLRGRRRNAGPSRSACRRTPWRYASISGGLLGFRSISADERTAVQRVAREIAEAHAEGARTLTAGASVGDKPARGAR